ncbi:MAG TPA: 3-dehydroquinate synthase family protein [Anaeromyxobacteraceae bacterium]|nr:3-dehydroquinate synthase family protein [Anaeromyxobacteraceae bacterium]
MSHLLEARQEGRAYPVEVGRVLPERAAELAAGRDRVALVSCAHVLATPLGRKVAAALRRQGRLQAAVALPDGERGKTLAAIERAAGRLLAAGLTRRSLLVALGGGAVTDAAGFLAAVFMRGLDWVALPTTLLAMVDAALGGKTAVNLPVAKNALGAFHPPRAVLSDPRTLRTLPARELRSGFGEALKYGLLRPELLPRLAEEARAGRASADLVAGAARVKLEIVERDPREAGERKLLNLGHTFGHGVEAAGGFRRWTHGEAVAVGMAFAFRLAARMGRLGPEAVEAAEAALAGAGLPVRVPAAVARRAAVLMGHDKKRTARGLMWVLPRRAGSSWTVEWDVPAEPAAVAATVREIGGTR